MFAKVYRSCRKLREKLGGDPEVFWIVEKGGMTGRMGPGAAEVYLKEEEI